jgi:Zn-dependent peptidase ImmA (M78 family)
MNAPSDIVRTLRSLMPMRPLTLSDAYAIAELQANTVVGLLGVKQLQAVDLAWIAGLPHVRLIARPRHEMPTLAGFTQWEDGLYLIVINRNNRVNRRRFTLAHELKHVIDHTNQKLIYARLGYGNIKKHDAAIEHLADYFAACLLMPRKFVKQAWTSGIQDVEALAQTFRVSVESMTIRLKYLGFLDDNEHPVEKLFRAECHLPTWCEPLDCEAA